MNTNSTQQTDFIENARKWWNSLNTWDRDALIHKHCQPYVAGSVDTVTILDIWRKETQPTTTDNGGELKCTPGEWYKHDNMILTKGTPHNRIGLMYIRGSVDREFRQKVDEEMEANLDLCVASKDLYNLVKKLVESPQPSLIADWLLEAQGVMKKANKNYKP